MPVTSVVNGSQGSAGPPQDALTPAGGGLGAAQTWGHSQAASPKDLPAVDKLLRDNADLVSQHGATLCAQEARGLLDTLRAQALRGELAQQRVQPAALAAALAERLHARAQPHLRAVINLTGTVLHTNLGRALLADEALAAIAATQHAPLNLEFDLRTGGRGDRDDAVEALLCELTGAEAATVVNNNAAAVLLATSALARGREVIVSRGELVEIGGAFRVPEVIESAGARLVEVGTTNRTHLRDYERAINDRTAVLMKVHPSNYAVHGFTAEVAEAELAVLAQARGLPLVNDLGSGALIDLAAYGLPREPVVREMVAAGCDVVCFSGDKLLGGPQAGLIVGKKALIARIKRDPLKRALRVSKLPLAALEATLRLYLHPEVLRERLPTLRLLTRPQADIAQLAEQLQPVVAARLGPAWQVSVCALSSQIGSGAQPVEVLPSAGLRLAPAAEKGRGRALEGLQARLRALPRPVLGRVADDALWWDLRTLEDAGLLRQALDAL